MRKVLLFVLLGIAISVGAKAQDQPKVDVPAQQPTCDPNNNVLAHYYDKGKTKENVHFYLENTNARKVTVHCWVVYMGKRVSNWEKFIIEAKQEKTDIYLYHWAGKEADFEAAYLSVDTYVEFYRE